MSDDEKKDAKGHDKAVDPKAAEAKAAKMAKIKAILGPVLAVVVLVGIGVGIGRFMGGLVTPDQIAQAQGLKGPEDPHATGTEGEGHGSGDGGDGGHGAGGGGHSILHAGTELVIDGIVSNVRDTGGKRFVKISPSFWILTEASTAIGMGGGGGHGGGGGEPAAETKRMLRTRIQEHLKEYSLDELTAKGIERKLEKAFRDIAEKELHALCPDIPASKQIVLKVVPADLAVQ